MVEHTLLESLQFYRSHIGIRVVLTPPSTPILISTTNKLLLTLV
jgi:hypothetical protein